jgi:hypothetical protein
VAPDDKAPTPAPEPTDEELSTAGLRGLAALLALALAFAAAVLIALAVDAADQKLREDCHTAGCEYFDGGSAQRAVTVAFLGLGGLFGVAGVMVCLLVATSGGSSRWMLPVTGMAILFGAIGVVVANV